MQNDHVLVSGRRSQVLTALKPRAGSPVEETGGVGAPVQAGGAVVQKKEQSYLEFPLIIKTTRKSGGVCGGLTLNLLISSRKICLSFILRTDGTRDSPTFDGRGYRHEVSRENTSDD